ncbi:uncharacterized protein CG13380 [Anopheles aquasalis]|uniref:uncharacterized protein CG13380 n=1 Tax=Anopheles aquasalis TaxID=42839 RepID=UPI00215B6B9F|nr:uncharacterized protein CG13380 [Anopheles aquasalis]
MGGRSFPKTVKQSITAKIQAIVNKKTPIETEDDRKAELLKLEACICSRQNTTIRCKRCANLFFGRILRTCPSHQNVIFLHDMHTCPVCVGPKGDLEELPIDFETYKKLVQLTPLRR